MSQCLVSDMNHILCLYVILCISFAQYPVDSDIFWNIFLLCFQSLFFLRMQNDIGTYMKWVKIGRYSFYVFLVKQV
jgi:hypothetical protein